MWGFDEVCRLAEEYENCDRCPKLIESRSQVVFGSGSARADLMLFGEASGAVEDELGVPFIGDSGVLLMNMLQLAWPENEEMLEFREIPESEDDDSKYFEELRDYFDQFVFWANIICCHPEKNRAPGRDEIKACRDRLERLVYAVDPMLVVALGKVAISAVLGKQVGIIDSRGKIFEMKITSPVTQRKIRYPVLAVLHPSYLLRKGDQRLMERKGEGETYNTVEDLRYGISLLNKHYQNLWGTSFPDKPEDYK